MPYRILEDISRADTAFEAQGKTLEELFESSALALLNVMVADFSVIEKTENRTVDLKALDVEELLHDFLQSLLYFKDAEQLFLLPQKILIQRENDHFKLQCSLWGEKIDFQKQEVIVDIKAVTYHRFQVEEREEGWRATVVLDV